MHRRSLFHIDIHLSSSLFCRLLLRLAGWCTDKVWCVDSNSWSVLHIVAVSVAVSWMILYMGLYTYYLLPTVSFLNAGKGVCRSCAVPVAPSLPYPCTVRFVLGNPWSIWVSLARIKDGDLCWARRRGVSRLEIDAKVVRHSYRVWLSRIMKVAKTTT